MLASTSLLLLIKQIWWLNSSKQNTRLTLVNSYYLLLVTLKIAINEEKNNINFGISSKENTEMNGPEFDGEGSSGKGLNVNQVLLP